MKRSNQILTILIVLIVLTCNDRSAYTASGKLAIYHVSPMKDEILDGTNLPAQARRLRKIRVRGARGEFEPFSFLINARKPLHRISIHWKKFSGAGTIPAKALDVHLVKVWWVNNRKIRMGWSKNNFSQNRRPMRAQEILLKDDRLIRVHPSAFLNDVRITNKRTGRIRYSDVSSLYTRLPENIEIHDSRRLLPFSLAKGRKKQVWLTMHIPPDAKTGIYRSQVLIKRGRSTLARIPFEVEVLPFDLEPPILHYGLYYKVGYFEEPAGYRPARYRKSLNQYLLELRDMKDHGFIYPGCHIDLEHSPDYIEKVLSLYEKAGLPTDKLISSMDTFVYKGTPSSISKTIGIWQKNLKKNKRKTEIYCYARDEARGQAISDQLANWDAVRKSGAKVWASISVGQRFYTRGKLDVAVLHGGLQEKANHNTGFDREHREEIKRYQAQGTAVWSYAHPFAGQENAEIYRRNYGLALWKTGYDGVMNFCYQFRDTPFLFKDFKGDSNFRDVSFVIPISGGVLSTISWEGMREAVDDVRYLSTLLNRIKALKKTGGDVSDIEKWLKNLDPYTGDLDAIRERIIDLIITLDRLLNLQNL
ncbi:MAG: hypothetical protein GY754_07470 [bacterium]|nr:hypothetical protein [bacterium]